MLFSFFLKKGTGKKGGMLSVFLMGCFDEKSKLWKTVTKVSGFDDKTMKDLQVFSFFFHLIFFNSLKEDYLYLIEINFFL